MAERPLAERYARRLLTPEDGMVPIPSSWLGALLESNDRLRQAIRELPHASGCPGRGGQRCVCGRSVLNEKSAEA